MTPNTLTAALLASTIPVFLSGNNYQHLAAAGFTQIKTGVGVYGGLSVNTVGTTSSVGLYDGTSSAVGITIATPGVVSWVGHPFVAGSAVKFSTTGALPTGLIAGTTYYVSTVGLTADAFSVADTRAHALAGTNTVATSGSQSGVQTAWNVTNPLGVYSTTAQASLPSNIQFQNGLIAYVVDAGAGDLTVSYQ